MIVWRVQDAQVNNRIDHRSTFTLDTAKHSHIIRSEVCIFTITENYVNCVYFIKELFLKILPSLWTIESDWARYVKTILSDLLGIFIINLELRISIEHSLALNDQSSQTRLHLSLHCIILVLIRRHLFINPYRHTYFSKRKEQILSK